MSQIVIIQIGTAGCLIGNSIWELFAKDHHLSLSGQTQQYQSHLYSVFYQQKNRFYPRSIIIDNDPITSYKISKGPLNDFYHQLNIICGKEDGAYNFAKGKQIGKKILEDALERVKSLVQQCCNLNSFIFVTSLSGGSGSSLHTLLSQILKKQYPKVNQIAICLFPSTFLYNSPVEVYNFILSTESLIQNNNLVICVNNDALKEICKRHKQVKKVSFDNLNQLIGMLTNRFTVNMRHNYKNIYNILTDLVPYPCMHFVIPSLTVPIQNEVLNEQMAIYQLFNNNNTLHSMGFKKHFTCQMCFQGNFNQYKMLKCLMKKQSFFQSKKYYSISKTPIPILQKTFFAQSPVSGVNLSNNYSITNIFNQITLQFNKIFNKRAFIYNYISNDIQQQIFTQCRENIARLLTDYDTWYIQEGNQ